MEGLVKVIEEQNEIIRIQNMILVVLMGFYKLSHLGEREDELLVLISNLVDKILESE